MAYSAFLSYSQGNDARLAHVLRSAIHRFAKPWYRIRAAHIFLDTHSLNADPSLWPAIQRALDESEFFILLASPASANSRWVERELLHWLEKKPLHRILVVVTGGTITRLENSLALDPAHTTALHSCLLSAFQEEPHYVDLRWLPEGSVPARDLRFVNAVAEIAACLRGRSKDELIGEDYRQGRRVRRLVAIVAIALVLLTSLSIAASYRFLQERKVAEERLRLSQEHLYTVHINQAHAAMQRMDVLGAAALLDAERAPSGRADRRGIEWYLLNHQMQGEAVRFNGPQMPRLRFFPNGRQLITAGAIPTGEDVPGMDFRGEAQIWDLPRGELAARLPHPRPITGVAVSPDGTVVATVTSAPGPESLRGDAFRLWSVPEGRMLHESRFPAVLSAVTYSADGKWIALGGAKLLEQRGTIHLVDGSSGELVRPIGSGLPWVRGLAFSPDGTRLAAASVGTDRFGNAAGWVSVWDVASGKQLATLANTPARHGYWSVQFTQDGQSLLAARDDGTAVLFGVESRTEITSFKGHLRGRIAEVAIAPGNRYVATAGADRTTRLWDFRTGQLIATIPEAKYEVSAVCFSPDGEWLASAALDGTMKLHSISKLRGDTSEIVAHKYPLNTLAFSSDGQYLAGGGNEGSVLLWRLPGRELAREIQHRGGVVSVAFHPNRPLLAVGGGATVRVHDLQADTVRETAVRGDVSDVAFARQGALLAIANDDVVLWDLERDTRHTIPKLGAFAVAFAGAGDRFAVGLEGPEHSASLLLLSTRSHRVLRKWRGLQQGILDLAVSPGGDVIATAGYEPHVCLWGFNTDDEIGRLRSADEGGAFYAVAFAPDGRTVATGTSNGAFGEPAHVKLWNPITGAEFLTLEPGTRVVRALAFSPNGEVLAAGGDDQTLGKPGKIRLWYAPRRD